MGKYVTTGSYLIIHEADDIDRAIKDGAVFTKRMEEGLEDGVLISEIVMRSSTVSVEDADLSKVDRDLNGGS